MEKIDIITVRDPKSPIAEAFRTLRTNIQFSSFDKSVQTVCITSSGPGEGKSTVSANLAVVMAEAGKRTLLIDCDQRKPMTHKIFKASNLVGLSNLLAGEVTIDNAIKPTVVDNLSIITAGIRPPNPSELLASAKMKHFIEDMKEKFDFIIFDTPPVLIVTDAQLLAGHTDGYLLVVSSGTAERNAAIKSKELLEKVNAKILGVILNKLDVSENSGYGKYYQYYYTEEVAKPTKKRK
ncbi:CpsD/CapB family tyrosine-protein kinase [Youngiibacter multivorans]|uniref:non-specific protein-tyrosine kinase n=1 Tax=Youngiibacter multivorans TaxID=937251 RepID=A0ABS4G292_9CLOT|nr:CpsD/CapB family tyrosine-protein kinase [Youngiibacter multivorans]MBP1918617.1 capsular exopolysaccharide synthesis family protein [Youngiibacter multivorans]